MRMHAMASSWVLLQVQLMPLGLQVAEADLVAVLLRSLPESVRTFCLHHTSGETYQSFRAAALRWEQQQRAFAEFRTQETVVPARE